MSLAPGSLVGPYQITAPLGAAAMGEVYRARDTRLNRDVAIKLLVPALTADAVALARFGREAQALAALSHPNIVPIYDVGQHDGRAFVVMEYLEGETLRRRMHVARLPLRRTIDYAIQLASALAAAHQRGIVHRDLKPENIFVTADGPLKVLDLGLATLALGTSAAGAASISPDLSTKPGTVLGTVGYMAPEQARGQAVDPRADIFSLGAVLYEMAIGRRAFAGDTAVDTLAAVLNSEPAEFPLDAQVPPALRCSHRRSTRRALEGPPIRVAAEVLQNRGTGWSAIGVSRNGVLAWRAPGFDEVQFEWVDRAGRTLSTLGRVDAYTNFDLSPDGSRVVVTLRREDAGASLYLLDTARNVSALISEQPVAEPISDPTWAPDGQTVAYRHGMRLVTRNAFGGEERALRPWPGYPDSWSRDGKYVTVGRSQNGEYGLWAIALDGKNPDIPLVNGIPVADEPKFSPDGHWVVFHAALQSNAEVYAIRFPPTGERWQLSTAGGVQPRWRADGQELYYLAPDGQLMSLDIPNGDPTRAGKPSVLFSLRIQPSVAFDQFAPSADGQRFLVRGPCDRAEPTRHPCTCSSTGTVPPHSPDECGDQRGDAP